METILPIMNQYSEIETCVEVRNNDADMCYYMPLSALESERVHRADSIMVASVITQWVMCLSLIPAVLVPLLSVLENEIFH